jgi:hypothetical protein
VNRRALLSAVAAGTASLAGCLDSAASRSDDSVPSSPTGTPACEPTTDGGARTLPYCIVTSDPPRDGEWAPEAPPEISLARGEQKHLVVTGATSYGSSSCGTIGVESLDVTDESELRVVVGPAVKNDAPRTCYGDIAEGRYELVVDLREAAVETVHVTERSDESEPTTQTATLPER